MKEITIKLNLTEEQEKELDDYIASIKDKNPAIIVTSEYVGQGSTSVFPVDKIESRAKLLKLTENPPKDEYTTLKEKCIELECKRLGVDKLLGIDVLVLESKLDLIDIYKYDRSRFIHPDKAIDNLKKEAIVKMKNYIDRVEKELKDKEFKKEVLETSKYYMGIDPYEKEVKGKGVQKAWIFKSNASDTLLEENSDSLIQVITSCCLKSNKVNYFNKEGLLLAFKTKTNDEIFEFYKDILSKEQIKELYKK